MRWFIENRILERRLALLALAVQFVRAFGHIHDGDIYGAAPPPAAMAAAVPDGNQPLPANHPSKHSDDYCAVCATMSLLGNSFVPAAPPLPLPSASHATEQVDRVAIIVIAPRRA